jgi:2-keto-4-pentenoate hydratase/2-oxohepta-3-ene-1,7-dioic acid hydratase in catechol pathway
MRLVSFVEEGNTRIGVLDPAGVSVREFRVPWVAGAWSMSDFIQEGVDSLASMKLGPARDLSDVKLLAPISAPRRNIICVGKNYHEHAREFSSSGFDAGVTEVVPEFPVIFTKNAGSVTGPGDPIPASDDVDGSVDYEGELAVVIGRSGRNIDPKHAMSHVFGYTIVNDVTARQAQRRHKQWFLGKSLDGFCPMGPSIVTRDEIPDLDSVELRTFVNGELRQKACIANLIFGVPEIVSTISRFMKLVPGDVIATGTPSGVGIGFNPPKFLCPGDEVVVEIDGIGELRNPVV